MRSELYTAHSLKDDEWKRTEIIAEVSHWRLDSIRRFLSTMSCEWARERKSNETSEKWMTLARRFKPTKRVCRGLYEVKQEERKEREVLGERAEEKIVLFYFGVFFLSVFVRCGETTQLKCWIEFFISPLWLLSCAISLDFHAVASSR